MWSVRVTGTVAPGIVPEVCHGNFALEMLPASAGRGAWQSLAQGVKKGRQNPDQLRENAKQEAVDQLAEQVFKEADGNHNHVLSRGESDGAEELLQTGIMNLVQQGVLGVPQRQHPGQGRNGKNQAPVQAPNGAAVFGRPARPKRRRARACRSTSSRPMCTPWPSRPTRNGQKNGPPK